MVFNGLRRLRQRPAPARKLTPSPRRRRRPLLGLEALEDRTLLSVITWTNPNGGDWGTAANWDLRRLPAAGDDVVIPHFNRPVEVDHSAGADTVHALTTAATLSLLGGSLSVATTVQNT